MAEFDQSDDEEEENILHMDDLKNLNKQRVRLCQELLRMTNRDSIFACAFKQCLINFFISGRRQTTLLSQQVYHSPKLTTV